MEKCKICGAYPLIRETEDINPRYYAACSYGGRRMCEGECCYGPECATRKEAESAWDELMRVQPVEAVRKPVCISPATAAAKACVICDDGSVFAMNFGDGISRVIWLETDPIPGTAADLARENGAK